MAIIALGAAGEFVWAQIAFADLNAELNDDDWRTGVQALAWIDRIASARGNLRRIRAMSSRYQHIVASAKVAHVIGRSSVMSG